MTKDRLIHDLRENVTLPQDLDVVAADFDVGAAVLAVDHLIADVHRELAALAAIEQLARANGQYLATLRLFFGRIRQNDSARGTLFSLDGLNNDAIIQRANFYFGHVKRSF